MKLILDDKILKVELPKFSGILKKSALTYSDKLLLEAQNGEIFLKGTNLDVYLNIKIPGKIEESGEVLIPYHRLLDIVRLSDSELTIKRMDNDWVQVVQGKSKNRVPSTSPSIMPEEPKVPNEFGEVDSEKFINLLKDTLFTSDSESNVETFKACNITSSKGLVTLLTGNGIRFTKSSARFFKVKDFECLIPKSNFEELQKLDGTLKIYISDNHVKFDNGTRSLTARRLSTSYPDVGLAFNQEIVDEIIFDKSDFELSIKKANQSSDDQHCAIVLNFDGDNLLISSASNMYGEYEELKPQKSVVKDSFYINGDFLIQFLNNYKKDKFKMCVSKNMFYFKDVEGNNYTHVIGLMRK